MGEGGGGRGALGDLKCSEDLMDGLWGEDKGRGASEGSRKVGSGCREQIRECDFPRADRSKLELSPNRSESRGARPVMSATKENKVR